MLTLTLFSYYLICDKGELISMSKLRITQFSKRWKKTIKNSHKYITVHLKFNKHSSSTQCVFPPSVSRVNPAQWDPWTTERWSRALTQAFQTTLMPPCG